MFCCTGNLTCGWALYCGGGPPAAAERAPGRNRAEASNGPDRLHRHQHSQYSAHELGMHGLFICYGLELLDVQGCSCTIEDLASIISQVRRLASTASPVRWIQAGAVQHGAMCFRPLPSVPTPAAAPGPTATATAATAAPTGGAASEEGGLAGRQVCVRLLPDGTLLCILLLCILLQVSKATAHLCAGHRANVFKLCFEWCEGLEDCDCCRCCEICYMQGAVIIPALAMVCRMSAIGSKGANWHPVVALVQEAVCGGGAQLRAAPLQLLPLLVPLLGIHQLLTCPGVFRQVLLPIVSVVGLRSTIQQSQ